MIGERIVFGVAMVLLASGCGSGPTPSSGVSEPATLPDAEPIDAASIPPTTRAEPVPSYTCDDPLSIAGNLLLERRQGAPASNCAAPDPWLEASDDFVDFGLDTTVDPSGTVRFVARYRTSDTTSETRAEALRFEAGDDGTWTLVEHVRVDLADELTDARSVATVYFDALADGDHRAAAELLVPTEASTERPDLDRLDADGLLDERTVGGITRALTTWCRTGAACGRPDDVRYEITPDHRIRIVATYEVGPTGFEVAFDTDGTSVVGIPPTP